MLFCDLFRHFFKNNVVEIINKMSTLHIYIYICVALTVHMYFYYGYYKPLCRVDYVIPYA